MFTGKKQYWNSIVFNHDDKIEISSRLNGKQQVITYDSAEDVIAKRQGGSNKSCKWVVVIPDSDCIWKEITLPAANIDEASKMLEYELNELVPLDPQKLVYGCYEMSHDSTSYNLSVCVIKKSLLDRYNEVLSRININPERILVHSVTLKEACNEANNCFVISANDSILLQIQYSSEKSPVSKYHIFDSNLRNGVINCLPELAEAKSLFYALPEDMNAHLKDYIQKEQLSLNTEDVSNYISDYKIKNGNYLSSLVSKCAISICKGSKHAAFNLMHKQELKKRNRKQIISSYFLNGGLLIIFILLIWLNLMLGNLRLNRRINTLDKQIEPIKDIAAQIEAKKIQLKAIKDQINSKGKVIKTLDDFYGYTPEDISLNEIKIEHEGPDLKVQIKGQAQDHASAFGYTEALKKSKYINGLNIGVGHMIPKADGKSIVEFSAECLLSEIGND